MKINSLALCSLLFISSINPSLLCAQGALQARIGTWEDVQKIPPGDELEVKLKTDRTVKGRLSSSTDAKLALTSKGQVTEVDRADVLSIKRVVPKSAARSTMIGAGVGAGAGAVAGLATAAADDGDDIGANLAPAAVIGFGLLGAGLGALAGGAFGLRKKKTLVYEAGP